MAVRCSWLLAASLSELDKDPYRGDEEQPEPPRAEEKAPHGRQQDSGASSQAESAQAKEGTQGAHTSSPLLRLPTAGFQAGITQVVGGHEIALPQCITPNQRNRVAGVKRLAGVGGGPQHSPAIASNLLLTHVGERDEVQCCAEGAAGQCYLSRLIHRWGILG